MSNLLLVNHNAHSSNIVALLTVLNTRAFSRIWLVINPRQVREGLYIIGTVYAQVYSNYREFSSVHHNVSNSMVGL